MAGLNLEKGAVVEYLGRRYTCGGRGPGGGFQLIPHKGRSNLVLKPEAAFDALEKNQLIPVQEEADYDGYPLPSTHFDLSALSDKEQCNVLMREFYMQRLAAYRKEGGTLSTAALNDFARTTHTQYVTHCRQNGRKPPLRPMSATALRKWFSCWTESEFSIQSLVRDAKGNSHRKLPSELLDIIDATISEQYLDKRRISARHAHTLMVHRIQIENRARQARGETPLPIPHYNTLLRYIDKVDVYEKLAARYSPAYAHKVTRQRGITPPVNRHLERVQMDHTLLDIYVDFGEKILVRPWLTLALDAYSKAILGYCITPSPASAESVMQTLRMAIMPKNMRELGGQSDWHWPMHGLPSELTLDNGKEFHGKDLEMAACELGITLNFTPPRQPWHKAQVERKFRDVNQSLLAQLNGQVFKYEPEEHGLDYPHLTLDQFKTIFLQWVTTVLHRRPNKQGKTPEALWLESVQKHGTPGGGLSSEYINQCLSKTGQKRVIHPNGIVFNNLTFNSEWLSRLRNELAPKDDDKNPEVQVKWSASDVGTIYVLHPGTHEYFPVQSKEKYAHGRSYHNHRVVLREQRAQIKAGMEDPSYVNAVAALDEAIKQAVSDMPKKGKKLGARFAQFESGKPEIGPQDGDDLAPGLQKIGDDIVDTDTGEIISASPTMPDDDDFEDFSEELLI